MDVFVERRASLVRTRTRFATPFRSFLGRELPRRRTQDGHFAYRPTPTLAPFLRHSRLVGLACRRNRLPRYSPLLPLPIPTGLDVARQPAALPLASSTTAVSPSTDPQAIAPPAGLIACRTLDCCSATLLRVINRLPASSHTPPPPPRLPHSDQSRWLPNRPSRLLLGNVEGALRPQSSRRTSASTSPSLQTHATGLVVASRAAPEATSSPPFLAHQA
jgi:hypothetical protein